MVRTLRTAGHDVRALAEEVSQTVDAQVIALPTREGRIVLTEDKDFGWLAFVAGAGSEGVILIRFPATARPLLGPSVLDLVASHGDALRGSFTVLQPGHARIKPRPFKPRAVEPKDRLPLGGASRREVGEKRLVAFRAGAAHFIDVCLNQHDAPPNDVHS